MMKLLLFFLLESRAQAACEELTTLADEVEQAVLAVEIPAGRAALQRVEPALRCDLPVDPTQLARLWLAEAVLETIDPNHPSSSRASQAFAAAARAQPSTWVSAYGDDLRAARDQAVSSAQALSAGRVELSPPPGIRPVWLDGRAFDPAQPVPAGLHALQVAGDTPETSFAQLIILPAGMTLTVETGLPTIQGPDPALVEDARRAIQRAATDEWNLANPGEDDLDRATERFLTRYLERYGDARVRVEGFEIPVVISQAAAARALLASLPERRALAAAREAEAKDLGRGLAGEPVFAPTLIGPQIGLGAGYVAASDGAVAAPRVLLTLGDRAGLVENIARGSLGLDFGLSGSFARGEEPSSWADGDSAQDLPASSLRLSSLRLLLDYERGAMGVGLGPTYNLGYLITRASGASDESGASDLPVPYGGGVFGPGAALSARYLWDLPGPLSLGPTLLAEIWSDGDRLYPSSLLTLTLRWRPAS